MRSIDSSFYYSREWKAVRSEKLKRDSLCERCLIDGKIVPAYFVHHKIYLTPENLTPEIALNIDNLESLCKDCHNREHHGSRKRYTVDEAGRVTIRQPPIER